MKNNQLILFGAGGNGILALEKYGASNIAYFCDNCEEKQGDNISGITVISFKDMIEFYHKGYVIMVTPVDNAYMIGQLELEGIYDYLIFHNEQSRFYFENHSEYERIHFFENSILDSLVSRTHNLDLLSDISEFKQLSEEALKINREKDVSLSHYRISGGESGYYGNLQCLMQYAKIPENEAKFFPTVSHQGCMLLYTPSFQYKSAVIMQGVYYKRKIHERAPYVPVFSVGPYIHYAKGIYTEERLKKKKREIGKMLLIFLPHSIERQERAYDKYLFIDDVLKEYGDIFQSIWCCVYWADINNSICEYAENKGIHIVTAGFRFDTKFNMRLKTILELADAVVIGDIGTFVAYALYMGKPIGRIDINNRKTIIDNQVRSDFERKLQRIDEEVYEASFYTIFTKELKNTNEQKEWIKEVNGFDQIKSSEYIKKIFQISKDIWIQCEGDLFRYPEAIRIVYSLYARGFEWDKMSILKEAVGAYVDL